MPISSRTNKAERLTGWTGCAGNPILAAETMPVDDFRITYINESVENPC